MQPKDNRREEGEREMRGDYEGNNGREEKWRGSRR